MAAPSRGQIVTVVTGVLMVVIMSSLDQSVVTPALPAIARDLHALEHLSWVVSAYMLTSTALTLVYGKLSDIHGRRGLMLFAIVFFVGSSLICALSQNVGQLIAARALQGAGAGGLLVTVQAMMADLVSPRERARYQVYVTSTFALASAAGPPLGGFLVDHLSWRWVFWVNLPFGILAYLICRRFPVIHVGTTNRNIDYAGLVLLTASVTLFLLVASWGGTVYAWSSLPVLGALAAGGCCFAAFIIRELRSAEPLFPPRLFSNSTIPLGDATIFLTGMLMFGVIVLVPVFLQLVVRVGAGSSGALLVPLLLGMASGSTTSSQIMRRTGRYKVLLPIGLTLTTIGYLLLSTMTTSTSPQVVAGMLLILGVGLGSCVPTVNVAVQNAADPRDLGVVISTVAFSRSLGGAFGAAIFWSLLLALLGRDLRLSDIEGAPPAALAAAFHDVFLVGAAIAVVAVVLVLQLREMPLKTTRPSERATSS